ncbi:MAG: hypothetical protein IPI73_18715 [Betaproteobacteria bacterium]|nr:hypothetical protein [Betaproteobacteria bacterium]
MARDDVPFQDSRAQREQALRFARQCRGRRLRVAAGRRRAGAAPGFPRRGQPLRRGHERPHPIGFLDRLDQQNGAECFFVHGLPGW